jgi:hypothetical protein
MAGLGSTRTPLVLASTMKSAGRSSSIAPTTKTSESAPRATTDLSPVSVKPPSARVAVVFRSKGSKRAAGSWSASAAAGASSETSAGR